MRERNPTATGGIGLCIRLQRHFADEVHYISIPNSGVTFIVALIPVRRRVVLNPGSGSLTQIEV